MSFGGGGSGRATSSTTGTVVADIPSWALGPLQRNLDRAESLTQTPFVGYDPNSRIAGLSQDEQDAFSRLRGNVDSYQPVFQDIIQRSLAGPSEQDISTRMNPYLDQVLNRLSRQSSEFYAKERNRIGDTAGASGAFGGSRLAVAEQEGLENAANTLADIQARETYNAFNQALGQYNTDLTRGLQGAESGFANLIQGSQAQAAAGEIDRRVRQGRADATYEEFLREQTFPYEQIAFLNQIAVPSGALVRGSTTEGSGTTKTKTGGGGLFGKADGGYIPDMTFNYADGGTVGYSTLSNAIKLAQVGTPGSVSSYSGPEAPAVSAPARSAFNDILGLALVGSSLFGRDEVKDSETGETRIDRRLGSKLKDRLMGRTKEEISQADEAFKNRDKDSFQIFGYNFADGGVVGGSTLQDAIEKAKIAVPDSLAPAQQESPQAPAGGGGGDLGSTLFSIGVKAALASAGVPSFAEGGDVRADAYFSGQRRSKILSDLLTGEHRQDEYLAPGEFFKMIYDAAAKGRRPEGERKLDAQRVAEYAAAPVDIGRGLVGMLAGEEGGGDTLKSAGMDVLSYLPVTKGVQLLTGGAKATGSIGAGLAKLIAKNPTASSFAALLGLNAADYMGDMQSELPLQEVSPVPEAVAQTSGVEAFDAPPTADSSVAAKAQTTEERLRELALQQLQQSLEGGVSAAAKGENTLSLKQKTSDKSEKQGGSGFSMPLLLAGAAALGTEGGAGESISNAIKAYVLTQTDLAKSADEKTQQEFENALELERLATSKQNAKIQDSINLINLVKTLTPESEENISQQDLAKLRLDIEKEARERALDTPNYNQLTPEEQAKLVNKIYQDLYASVVGGQMQPTLSPTAEGYKSLLTQSVGKYK